jgi:hypothetical protein
MTALRSFVRMVVASSALAAGACDGHSGDRDGGTLGDAGAPGSAVIGVGRAHDPSWVTLLGGSGDDHAFAVHASAGGLFVGGGTSSAWFGSFTDPCVAAGEHAGEDCGDAFVAELASGTGVQFGDPQTDEVRGIASGAGVVYLAGKSREDETRRYQNDGWAASYRADFSQRLWTIDLRNAGRVDEMLALAHAGDLFMAGGSAAELEPPMPTAGVEDGFLMRADTAGAVVRLDQFGSARFEEMMGIAADELGVYAIGQTGGYLDDEPRGRNRGSTDAILVIRDRDLEEVCRVQFGTELKDVGQAIAVTGDAIFVAGWTEGTINGELDGGATCNQDDGRADAIRADAFVARYDRSCAHVWTRQFGTTGGDIVESIATDGELVYVAGDFGGGLDHRDVHAPTKGFLRTYDLDGELEAEIAFDGDTVLARAVTIDETFAYVAGGAAGMPATSPALGGLDVFVASVPLGELRDRVTPSGDGCP